MTRRASLSSRLATRAPRRSRWDAALRYGLVAVAFAAVTSSLPTSASAEEKAAPRTVPLGVTLVEVVRELNASAAQLLWVRLGDSAGGTLLFRADGGPGEVRCGDDCAVEFPPLLAPADAEPFADWSPVRRPDGRLQWAYQSHPLHTWSREEEPGEVATNVGLAETANMKLAERAAAAGALLPPPEWRVARFEPARSVEVPAGIAARLVSSAQAVVLTDFEGFTLYASDGVAENDARTCSDRGCEMDWLPVPAPALALDVGRFSVVTRKDGSRQWAYRGRPLYRYRGDLLPGDVHGRAVDEGWTMAVLTENFRPPRVAVTALEGYGDALSLGGMTLYTGSAFEKYWGGRNLRDSFRNAYDRGKRLGGDACADAECLTMWRPFHAAVDARSTGFWEVFARRDGSRQWAYKGYAVYTYAGDAAPGQNRGQATYAFATLDGSSEDIERAVWLAELGGTYGGAGVYWNIAKP